MNNQNTPLKKPDLNQFSLALIKALELGLLSSEPPNVQNLILIHHTLNHNFLTKMWEKYQHTARSVYREHILNKNKNSARSALI